jgi:hypothetical protein
LEKFLNFIVTTYQHCQKGLAFFDAVESKGISKLKTLSKKYRKLTVEPKKVLECGSETLSKPFLLHPILSSNLW